jgi:hypothetical protein
VPRLSFISNLSTIAALVRWNISTIAVLFLLTSCSNQQEDAEESATPVIDWMGTQEEFQKSFDPTSGQFVFLPENQVFTGLVRISGSPTYEVRIREGIPVLWVESESGKSLLRWYQKGCWVGCDSAWEEDFQETENGLLHIPSNRLFTGKVFSMNHMNGQILAEYAYKNGVSDGPEIYYDDNMQEESRIVWVNGVIPIRKL